MTLQTSYQMPPAGSTGEVNAFVKCAGLPFSLRLQGLRKAFLVEGLHIHATIKEHPPGFDGGMAQDQGCTALTAGHSTWPQPVTGDCALHSGSRTQFSLGLRMLSHFLGFPHLQTYDPPVSQTP